MIAITSMLSEVVGEENANRLGVLGDRVVDQVAVGVGVGTVMVVAQEVTAVVGPTLGALGFLGTAMVSWRHAKMFYCIYLSSEVSKNIKEIFGIALNNNLGPDLLTFPLQMREEIYIKEGDVTGMKRLIKESREVLRQIKSKQEQICLTEL